MSLAVAANAAKEAKREQLASLKAISGIIRGYNAQQPPLRKVPEDPLSYAQYFQQLHEGKSPYRLDPLTYRLIVELPNGEEQAIPLPEDEMIEFPHSALPLSITTQRGELPSKEVKPFIKELVLAGFSKEEATSLLLTFISKVWIEDQKPSHLLSRFTEHALRMKAMAEKKGIKQATLFTYFALKKFMRDMNLSIEEEDLPTLEKAFSLFPNMAHIRKELTTQELVELAKSIGRNLRGIVKDIQPLDGKARKELTTVFDMLFQTSQPSILAERLQKLFIYLFTSRDISFGLEESLSPRKRLHILVEMRETFGEKSLIDVLDICAGMATIIGGENILFFINFLKKIIEEEKNAEEKTGWLYWRPFLYDYSQFSPFYSDVKRLKGFINAVKAYSKKYDVPEKELFSLHLGLSLLGNEKRFYSIKEDELPANIELWLLLRRALSPKAKLSEKEWDILLQGWTEEGARFFLDNTTLSGGEKPKMWSLLLLLGKMPLKSLSTYVNGDAFKLDEALDKALRIKWDAEKARAEMSRVLSFLNSPAGKELLKAAGGSIAPLELILNIQYAINAMDGYKEKKAEEWALLLYREYGILHFARYPPKVLKKLADDVEKARAKGSTKRHIEFFVITASHDHNGALYTSRGLFLNLLHTKGFVVVEVKNKEELLQRLRQFKRKLGNATLLITAHGYVDMVALGEDSDLTTEDKDVIDKLTERFHKVVFISCETAPYAFFRAMYGEAEGKLLASNFLKLNLGSFLFQPTHPKDDILLAFYKSLKRQCREGENCYVLGSPVPITSRDIIIEQGENGELNITFHPFGVKLSPGKGGKEEAWGEEGHPWLFR